MGDYGVKRSAKSVGSYEAETVNQSRYKSQQAKDFVRKLKAEKEARNKQHKMMTEAKDAEFLTKL